MEQAYQGSGRPPSRPVASHSKISAEFARETRRVSKAQRSTARSARHRRPAFLAPQQRTVVAHIAHFRRQLILLVQPRL